MSYTTFSKNSTTYLFTSGVITQCRSCCLNPRTKRIKGKWIPYNDDVWFDTLIDAYEHLEFHKKNGHKVPKSALAELRKDAYAQELPNKCRRCKRALPAQRNVCRDCLRIAIKEVNRDKIRKQRKL